VHHNNLEENWIMKVHAPLCQKKKKQKKELERKKGRRRWVLRRWKV
jgi:hypothetical protein